MIVRLASNGYITDDENGRVLVYTERDKYDLYKEILGELEEALLNNVNVRVRVEISALEKPIKV